MKLGMVGLGKMGGNMAQRLTQGGHEVVGYDPASEASDVASLEELVSALGSGGGDTGGEKGGGNRRVVWSMVPAGAVTTQTIDALAGLLSPGDVVVDGGNSRYTDSIARAERLAAEGIGFVDAGVSGGVWGLSEGYALMVGGHADHVGAVAPALDCLAPPNGFSHVGPAGTGHFTKMVHNGIEYGVMQALAEGVAVMEGSELDIDIKAALASWQEGSVIRSWLLDLLVRAWGEHPGLSGVAGIANDSGEGRWTVQAAIEEGVAAPVISAALFARFVSQEPDQMSMKVINALRNQFGGHDMPTEQSSGSSGDNGDGGSSS